MYDSDDVSDLGTPSSAMYDQSSSSGSPQRQVSQAPEQRAQPVAQRSYYQTPEQRPQVPEQRTQFQTPLQQPRRNRADGSDLSDLGTPSSVLYDDQPQASQQRSVQQRSFRQSPERSPEQEDQQDVFTIDYAGLERLMRISDPTVLKSHIDMTYRKIGAYDFLSERVVRLLRQYGPKGTHVSAHTSPGIIVAELRRVLEEAQKKWAMFDIPIQDLGLLQGSVIAAKLESSKQRISEVLDTANRRAHLAEQRADARALENLELVAQIEHLNNELERAYDYIKRLRGEHLHEEPPLEEEFMKGLKQELTLQENLNSSFRTEIENMRVTNQQLYEKLIEMEEEQTEEHHRKLQELAEAAKDLELNEGIRKAVVEKIKGLTANTDEVNKAVNEWMRSINEAIGAKKEVLQNLSAEVKDLDDKVAERRLQLSELRELAEEMDSSIISLEESVKEKEEQYGVIENAFRSIATTVSSLAKQYRDIAGDDENSEQFYSFTDSVRSPRSPRSPVRPRGVSIRSPIMSPRLGPIYEDSDESREIFRASSGSSPSRHRDFTPPDSIESSPSGRAASTPHSGPSLHFSPEFPQGRIAPGTQTLSSPRSRFAPEIVPFNPSTQTISGVTNRFDVGQSYRQSVHADTSTPYSQITRVESPVPIAGPSRMSDSPLNIRHRADLAPDGYVTPFISKTRFGYTDPKAKVLNLPPGGNFQLDTGLKKTLLLSSARRQEPLVVNIDIDPKPLTETESGEHFICDISLNLQQTGRQQKSPVITYGEPPAVTPTTDRRHGLFTPKGIFKKRHYNFRRVNWPDESDLPWSPHGLPDARSPISGLVPSPYISDSSVSWERSYPSYPSSEDRTFRGLSSSSPSPVIKRPYQKSPSSGYPSFDSSYNRSVSPRLDGTYDISRSPEFDRTRSRSPSPRLDRTYDVSSSPRSQSPGLDKTRGRSRSPELDATYDRSGPSGLNTTYDSHAGTARGTFDSHGQSYFRSSSPRYDSRPPSSGSYRQSAASALDGTFDRSAPTSRSGGLFSRSPSPQVDRMYGSSSPSRMNQTFSRSPSPQQDMSYDNEPHNTGFYQRDETQFN